MKPPEEFETPQLRLRLPALEDAPSIFDQYARDPEVTRYLVWRPHRYIDETREFLRRCKAVWKDGSAFPWIIIRRADEQLVGMIEIRISGHTVSLGYVLARSYWGKGYAPEAVETVVDWALGQSEIYRVWAVCDVENRASARVLEKSRMVCEGTLHRWMIHPNRSDEPRDCYCYAITK
ncbi:MAG: GNAT family N-acetyltransferase [Acidobacteriia bacterium]|nr:GNAT family N-acetyltransferase [Terriglobia bacterium]